MIEPELIPWGVGDVEGRLGAVGQGIANVDLIDLVAGCRLRRATGIGSPLMIVGPQLLGWQVEAGTQRMRLFRLILPPDEARLDYSTDIALPEWAIPHPGPEADFTVRFGRDGDVYVLFWNARRRYSGGAAPPAALLEKIGRQHAFGRVDFDVHTLAERQRRRQDGFADDRDRAQRGETLARQCGAFVYRRDGQLHNAPWATPEGERYLRSPGVVGAEEQRLSIVRADAPDASPIVSMDAVELDHAVPELSLDGVHLAVVEREADVLQWRIYSAVDGSRAATLPYHAGLRSLRLFGRRILYAEVTASGGQGRTTTTNRILHAADSMTGRALWSLKLEPVTAPSQLVLRPAPGPS